ncbi:MAG: precorrin-2 C(20)-methyltransferase, partial [Halofilum sp. (in: g-proteobacteria)]
NLPRIRQALRAVGMEERAWYVERASMVEERVMPLADAPEGSAPYFSLILVPGRGERHA